MTNGKSERQYVFEGMEILYKALIPFVEGRLGERGGGDWRREIARQYRLDRDEDGRIFWDQTPLLKAINRYWEDAFKTVLGDAERDIVEELIKVRNKLAHYKRFSYFDAWRALDSMLRLTRAVGADKAAAQIDLMCYVIPWDSDTAFNGFPFRDVDFGYSEGKKILGLAMDELRKRARLREIGIDPDRSGRRIHNDGGSVWDVLVFDVTETWRTSPHLTLGVGSEYVSAMVTLPNKAPAKYRKSLIKLNEQGFRRMVGKVLEEMGSVLSICPGMEPRLRVRQRRRPSPSEHPLMDALIDVDLRTCIDEDDAVKFQPQWIDAAFDALGNKKANLELQIGAKFPYRTCAAMANHPLSINLVVSAWVSCKPYIDALFGIPKDAPAAPELRGGTLTVLYRNYWRRRIRLSPLKLPGGPRLTPASWLRR